MGDEKEIGQREEAKTRIAQMRYVRRVERRGVRAYKVCGRSTSFTPPSSYTDALRAHVSIARSSKSLPHSPLHVQVQRGEPELSDRRLDQLAVLLLLFLAPNCLNAPLLCLVCAASLLPLRLLRAAPVAVAPREQPVDEIPGVRRVEVALTRSGGGGGLGGAMAVRAAARCARGRGCLLASGQSVVCLEGEERISAHHP